MNKKGKYLRTLAAIISFIILSLGLQAETVSGINTGIKIKEIITDKQSAAALTSDLMIQEVTSLFDTLAILQSDVPVTVRVKNQSDTEIIIQYLSLNFSFATTGDRNSDYLVTGIASADSVLSPNETGVFEFEVDLLSRALLDVSISIKAFVVGERQDDLQSVSAESDDELYTLDHFEVVSFDNNYGTYNWDDNWVEIGESDGPDTGNVVVSGTWSSIMIGDSDPYTEVGLSRNADLSEANEALFEFKWGRDPVYGFNGSFLVQVSENGIDGWATLLTMGSGADEYYISESLNITEYISNNTTIRFVTEGLCSGWMFIDDASIGFESELTTHWWTVLSEALMIGVALFDTRQTPDRLDDSLMVFRGYEAVSLNTIHYMNNGISLADIPIGGSSIYRLAIQFNSTFDWDWNPKDAVDEGYWALTDTSSGFGRISMPQSGFKEILLTETIIEDEEDDPVDILIGLTGQNNPAHRWDFRTDPWTDPIIDNGRLLECGVVTEALDPVRSVIGCKDGEKNWELTGDCEDERSYFHEIWFQPDLEWLHGDTADVFLHIEGKDSKKNLEQLHLLFNMLDDDIEGPVIFDYSPEILGQGEYEYITCRITDPSGIYDDESGVGGQGVYLIWDVDGSLEDDYNDIKMSPVGGGYFRSDVTVGGQAEGVELIYSVHACDDDSDTGASDRACTAGDIQTIQTVSSAPVYDAPSSLSPEYVYPGQQGVTFSINLSNPNAGGIAFLPAVSYLEVYDGTSTLTTYLANETVLGPGAAGFPIAFDPLDIPVGFSAPDTIELMLHLQGTYMEVIYWDQTWTASVTNGLIVRQPTLNIEAHAIPSPDVNPGDRNIELMRLELNLTSVMEVLLDSLIVSNPAARMPSGSASDVNIERLYLYKQGAPLSESAFSEDNAGPEILTSRPFGEGDSLLASATLKNGGARFILSGGRFIPPWESVYYYVVADVDSFSASDGEFLDIDIFSPDSVFISGDASVSFEELPLNSEGSNRIDGFISFQVQIIENLPNTIYSGDSDQLVFTVVLPANGHTPDILSGFSAWNFGDAEVIDLIENLSLWADKGNGLFSAGDDKYLGLLQNTGERFQISGISQPVVGTQRLFLTAEFGQDFTDELEVRFGIPVGGVDYISGNDGPLDSEIITGSSQVLIRRESIIIETFGSPNLSGTVHPGDYRAEILGMRIVNNTLDSVTIDSLKLRAEETLFSCESSKTFELFQDDGDGVFDPAFDTRESVAAWSEGNGFFEDFSVEIASGSEAVLFVSTDLDSFNTVDGETLSVWLESAADLHLTAITDKPYEIDGDFPLVNDTAPITDGMLSFQLNVYSSEDSTISGRTKDILILDLAVPGNGCRDDTLTGITVINDGTAGKEHIERVIFWKDDGNGLFDPEMDDSLTILDPVDLKSYSSSTLAVPLSGASGQRLFVSVDLVEGFTTGASILAGIPIMGVEVDSDNDGPTDKSVFTDRSVLIPVPNRVTLFTSILGNKRVQAGEKNVLNMVLGAYNSYALPKILQSIKLIRNGTARPDEIVRIVAYSDADEDGLFDPERDDLLQAVESSGVLFDFDELNMTLAPFKSSQIFIVYDIPAHGIRDSVSVDFSISDQLWIGFASESIVVEGEFPLNSAGEDLTDGMIADQIGITTVHSARVSPGDVNVPCFSFQLPCNGTDSDSLVNILLENEGSGMPGIDIEYLKLWKEAGGDNESFDPGEEEFIDYIVWNGSSWGTISNISEFIDCGGLLLHVTADFSAMAVDGRTVHLSLPVESVEVLSGNDGPIDRMIKSAAIITVTTAPIIVAFDKLLPVTVGQEFDPVLLISNVTDSSLVFVRPDSFLYSGDGSINLLSGPTPANLDLGAHGDSSFAWTFTASAAGSVVFQAKALEDGGSAESRLEYSEAFLIENVPENLNITIDDLSPVSLNRGYQNASVMEIIVSYGSGCAQCAGVDLASIDILFTDGTGGGIAVKDVASKVSMGDESMVLFSISTSTMLDSVISISLSDPVLFYPGEMKTFRISLDIAEEASAESFKLLIKSAEYFELLDHNNSSTVSFGGSLFPWSTNMVTLKNPAVELLAGMEAYIPSQVNSGQEDLKAFSLILYNSGGLAGADISVSEVEFKTIDTEGELLAPGDFLKKLRLSDISGYSHYVAEVFPGSSGVCCVLQPEIVVSAQVPVVLNAFLDFLEDPIPPGFSFLLQDTLCIAARDINSGQTLKVKANTSEGYSFPMSCGQAVFVDPLKSFTVSGEGLLPDKVTAGEEAVDALRLFLQHTGATGESRAAISGLSLRMINQIGDGVPQNSIISAIKVESTDSILCSEYPTAQDTSSYITLTFAETVFVEQGSSLTLDISLELKQDVLPGYFQIYLYGNAIEVSDGTSGIMFNDLEGSFPLSSGLAQIILPADRIFFEAEGTLPDNIVTGEKVKAFDLHFERESGTGESLALIEYINLSFADENNAPVDIAGTIEEISLENGTGVLQTVMVPIEEGIRIEFEEAQRLGSGESIDFSLYLKIVSGTGIKMVSAMVRSPSDISSNDETTGEPVAVEPVGDSQFPFNSGRATLMTSSLEGSFSNYPNPFVASREKTRITFYLPGDGNVTIQVFTILGRLVKTLAMNEERSQGPHQDILWDGKNGRGEKVINGVYYLVLKAEINGRDQIIKRKVALVR